MTVQEPQLKQKKVNLLNGNSCSWFTYESITIINEAADNEAINQSLNVVLTKSSANSFT